jgi:hypothetical protein
VILTADHSGARLGDGFTTEQERESFSNRRADRKILPENNVLSVLSACPFYRWSTKIKAA